CVHQPCAREGYVQLCRALEPVAANGESKILKLLNGPQTSGNTRGFWFCALLVLVATLIYPVFAGSYSGGNTAYLLAWVFMALGLCLLWGYGGMLSFGQTFFFGIGGYSYGVLATNFGGGGMTLVALLLALALA